MRGVWLEKGRLRLRDDLAEPVPGPGEALIRVRLAGICGTDLELLRGYAEFTGIPGHEFVGEVVESPDSASTGGRVVGRINLACGRCEACRAGRGNHCRRRGVLGIRGRDGAFAEFLTLPVDNLLSVPADVPDEAAVFCEPLAAAFRIPEQVPVSASQRVLVIGAGRLGQLVARVLALSGCRLEVAVRGRRQWEALEGVAPAVAEEDVQPAAADLVVEASGSPAGFRLARRAVRPGGAIVLKSTYRGAAEVDLSSLAVDEVRLVGSRCGPFEPALDALRRGVVDPRPLIDDVFPLDSAMEAFEKAGRREVLKVLIGPALGTPESHSADSRFPSGDP